MTVFVTSGSNKPSGGTKVCNQLAWLFQKHGYESYVVPADSSGTATFLNEAVKAIDVETYASMLSPDDISIDFWPEKSLVDVVNQKINRKRIFWQHGASIPKKGLTVGDSIFKKGNPYTQHWNVSKACADYLQEKYNLEKMPIVHPFFDSPSMEEFVKEKDKGDREGLLLLERRGANFIPSILEKFSDKLKITVLKQPYHEKILFQELLKHKFFVSVDGGINKPTLERRFKSAVKKIISSDFRDRSNKTNTWIFPEGHLLGFPMPPVEAAWLGTIVIGFAMGGGLEWMNKDNCFLAKDRDQDSLLLQIDQALMSSEKEIEQIRSRATVNTAQFNQEHTWNQISRLLDL